MTPPPSGSTAAWKIVANVPVPGTSAPGNTSIIQVLGVGADDALSPSEADGAFPRALLEGGKDDDTLSGGDGNDALIDGHGDDVILGRGTPRPPERTAQP